MISNWMLVDALVKPDTYIQEPGALTREQADAIVRRLSDDQLNQIIVWESQGLSDEDILARLNLCVHLKEVQ